MGGQRQKNFLISDFGFGNSKYHRSRHEIKKQTKLSFPIPLIITIFDKTRVKNHDYDFLY